MLPAGIAGTPFDVEIRNPHDGQTLHHNATTLIAVTSDDAQCTWRLRVCENGQGGDNCAGGNPIAMEHTGGRLHTQNLVLFEWYGNNLWFEIYVWCADNFGNHDEDMVQFRVQLPQRVLSEEA